MALTEVTVAQFRFFTDSRSGLPGDHHSAHLQRLEGSHLRRMCRLINDFGKLRQGILQKKMLEKYVQSRNVYENKQTSGKMPGKKSDIYV
jgi:hypothetical protein